MPRLKSKTVFTFDELSSSAKEAARNWWRAYGLDYEWWGCTLDDSLEILRILGYSVDRKNVQFSGFASQGDGASFFGSYSYRKGAAREIRSYAPQDNRLHAIADALQAMQRRNFYRVTGSIGRGYGSGNYVHEMTMSFEVDRSDETCWSQSAANDAEEAFAEASRDLARWLYRVLESEYDYLMSDESVDETIRANAYEFDECGSLA
jgi:hypothetical protein